MTYTQIFTYINISCICHLYIYISCICHAYIMYISCIYHVYVMSMPSLIFSEPPESPRTPKRSPESGHRQWDSCTAIEASDDLWA